MMKEGGGGGGGGKVNVKYRLYSQSLTQKTVNEQPSAR